MARNTLVERAVGLVLARIDYFIEGGKLSSLPSPQVRAVIDAQITKPNSTRLASLFFIFYSIVDADWDCNSVPTGTRGQFGDKSLATGLSLRNIALHNAITAFAENLGWKGNVTAARLQGDVRFEALSKALCGMKLDERTSAADYMASKFADSRQIIAPLPPVGDDVLTYGRARELFYELLAVRSEGNIQQFLIAALLKIHRVRYGHEIRTHHVHASDKYDTTAGDIEERRNEELVRAYEVTVRPDWKNRVADFRKKMDAANLNKYTIIASDVRSDEDLAVPAKMVKFLTPFGRDIAVVDIHDFVNVFAMELSAAELRAAVNQTYSFLTTPSLCGRADIIERFSSVVSDWLDSA
jgi:hypothetical protein